MASYRLDLKDLDDYLMRLIRLRSTFNTRSKVVISAVNNLCTTSGFEGLAASNAKACYREYYYLFTTAVSDSIASLEVAFVLYLNGGLYSAPVFESSDAFLTDSAYNSAQRKLKGLQSRIPLIEGMISNARDVANRARVYVTYPSTGGKLTSTLNLRLISLKQVSDAVASNEGKGASQSGMISRSIERTTSIMRAARASRVNPVYYVPGSIFKISGVDNLLDNLEKMEGYIEENAKDVERYEIAAMGRCLARLQEKEQALMDEKYRLARNTCIAKTLSLLVSAVVCVFTFPAGLVPVVFAAADWGLRLGQTSSIRKGMNVDTSLTPLGMLLDLAGIDDLESIINDIRKQLKVSKSAATLIADMQTDTELTDAVAALNKMGIDTGDSKVGGDLLALISDMSGVAIGQVTKFITISATGDEDYAGKVAGISKTEASVIFKTIKLISTAGKEGVSKVAANGAGLLSIPFDIWSIEEEYQISLVDKEIESNYSQQDVITEYVMSEVGERRTIGTYKELRALVSNYK